MPYRFSFLICQNMRLIPYLILGGAAVVYFLRMRSFGRNVQVVPRAIKIQGGSILQPNIVFTLGIQNPTNAQINIQSITGELLFEGKSFANFTMFTPTTLARNSETEVRLTAIPNLIGALSIVRDVIMEKPKDKSIVVNGRINANGVIMPFRTQYRF